MIIFIRELKKNFKSYLIWSICLIVANVFIMSFYPTFKEKMEIMDLMKTLPKEMVSGLGLDVLNFSNILDYLAYMMGYLNVFIGVYAMLLGSGIVSKEESDKTIEFLLSKPVTRNQILTSKITAAAFYVTALSAALSLGDYLALNSFSNGNFNINTFIWIHFGTWMMQLTFLTIGLLISIFVVKAKSVFPISLGIVLGSYFLSIVSAITEDLENLKYITPLKYINPADIIRNGNISGVYITIMIIVITAAIGSTYVLYNRKNISV